MNAPVAQAHYDNEFIPPVQAARYRVDLGSQDRRPSVAPGGSSSQQAACEA